MTQLIDQKISQTERVGDATQGICVNFHSKYYSHVHFLGQVQRNLQLRIEEQGRQLKMMFDEQQKTTSGLFKNHKLDTSPAEPSISLKDVEDSISEGYGNSNFPSKISQLLKAPHLIFSIYIHQITSAVSHLESFGGLLHISS